MNAEDLKMKIERLEQMEPQLEELADLNKFFNQGDIVESAGLREFKAGVKQELDMLYAQRARLEREKQKPKK